MDIKQKTSTNTVVVEKEKKHGFWRFFFLSLYIVILGAFGAVLADRIIFPRLGQMEAFKNSDFLKRTVEHTTIMNKTEQVVVPGDFLGQKIFEENKSSSLEIKENPESRIPNPETSSKKESKETEETKETGIMGFAVTQDGVIFSPNFPSDLTGTEKRSFLVKNFQGEEREAELLGDKSDDDILVFRYSGDRMNIPVLAFSDSVKPGEEAAIVSQNSVITAFVKSVSDVQILLNDYPDISMNGALVLNKDGKIIGMYRIIIDDGEISSYVIPANVLKNKISEVLR